VGLDGCALYGSAGSVGYLTAEHRAPRNRMRFIPDNHTTLGCTFSQNIRPSSPLHNRKHIPGNPARPRDPGNRGIRRANPMWCTLTTHRNINRTTRHQRPYRRRQSIIDNLVSRSLHDRKHISSNPTKPRDIRNRGIRHQRSRRRNRSVIDDQSRIARNHTARNTNCGRTVRPANLVSSPLYNGKHPIPRAHTTPRNTRNRSIQSILATHRNINRTIRHQRSHRRNRSIVDHPLHIPRNHTIHLSSRNRTIRPASLVSSPLHNRKHPIPRSHTTYLCSHSRTGYRRLLPIDLISSLHNRKCTVLRNPNRSSDIGNQVTLRRRSRCLGDSLHRTRRRLIRHGDIDNRADRIVHDQWRFHTRCHHRHRTLNSHAIRRNNTIHNGGKGTYRQGGDAASDGQRPPDSVRTHRGVRTGHI
jgi:hypothetical protein